MHKNGNLVQRSSASKWGKWGSEIRVPGSPERLWLGTYTSPVATAVAHDVAFYCLRRPSWVVKLNFPAIVPSYGVQHYRNLSPRSVQTVASDAGMAIDAKRIGGKPLMMVTDDQAYSKEKWEVDHIQSVELEFSSMLKNQNQKQNLDSGQNPKNMHRRQCEVDLDSDGLWWEGGGDDGGTGDLSEGD